MPNAIRVLLADDHDVVRDGIKSLLRAHDEFVVVGEARDGLEAVEQARALKPDLVVMDLHMPKMSGVEACREVRSELSTNVLILTSYSDEKAVLAAVLAGASGFVIKEVHSQELIEAMRSAGRGNSLMSTASGAAVIDQIRRGSLVTPEDRLFQQLSEREHQILAFIAEGLTNREIGERLFLSEKTIKHHVSDILGKLGFRRRVEAAGFAVRYAAHHQPDEA